MSRDRGVKHDDRSKKSLVLKSGLYESTHHPRFGEPSGADIHALVEIHAVNGFGIDIVRETTGSLWLRVRRNAV